MRDCDLLYGCSQRTWFAAAAVHKASETDRAEEGFITEPARLMRRQCVDASHPLHPCVQAHPTCWRRFQPPIAIPPRTPIAKDRSGRSVRPEKGALQHDLALRSIIMMDASKSF